jgi:hypothetical protein
METLIALQKKGLKSCNSMIAVSKRHDIGQLFVSVLSFIALYGDKHVIKISLAEIFRLKN